MLEKHIGNGTNERHCEDACKEFHRIRDDNVRTVVEFCSRIQTSNGFGACEVVRQVISTLRARSEWERLPN